MKQAISTLRAEALRIYRALPEDGWADTEELRTNMIASLNEHYEAIALLETKLGRKCSACVGRPCFCKEPSLVPTEVVLGTDRSKDLVRQGLAMSADIREMGRKMRANPFDEYYDLFSDPKPEKVAEPTFKERFERTPDGFINNCAMVFGEEPESCQICNGSCPDKAKLKK